jgi:hypothetical protein
VLEVQKEVVDRLMVILEVKEELVPFLTYHPLEVEQGQVLDKVQVLILVDQEDQVVEVPLETQVQHLVVEQEHLVKEILVEA